jgi:hypothetical protein
VTALPGTTTLNLNAADEEMLALLFRDPLIAQRLVAVRARQGYLTAKDLADQNVSLPWGTSSARTPSGCAPARRSAAPASRGFARPVGIDDPVVLAPRDRMVPGARLAEMRLAGTLSSCARRSAPVKMPNAFIFSAVFGPTPWKRETGASRRTPRPNPA